MSGNDEKNIIMDIIDIQDFIEWYWKEIDGKPSSDSSLTVAEYYFEDKRKEKEETEWTNGGIICGLCGHQWIAVYREDCEMLECPRCHNMTHVY